MTSSTTTADDRLRAALDQIRKVFVGMTARPDETNCECHWGSAEELALLKVPGVPLDPDLLYRTWSVPDWEDHGAVIRRILPQLAEALVVGECLRPQEAGRSLARSGWRDWPAAQSTTISGFLHAWWARTLEVADPPQPASDVFETCVTASGSVTPWLAQWAARRDPVADRHLLDAVEGWTYDLVGDQLPWTLHWDDDETALARELNAWLARHAPARLAAQGAEPFLLHRMGMLGVPIEVRWDEERCPDEYRRLI